MEDQGVRLFPEAASTIAPRVDAIYLALVGMTVFWTLVICALILGFGIRFRRGARRERSNPAEHKSLEIAWTILPLVIAVSFFAWGAYVYSDMRKAHAGALEINVVGKQWMWKAQHPAGNWEINSLHVPIGQPVRLRMISEDVIHSFFVPAFRVKQDVLPGYYTQLWFEPTKTGQYHLFCAEYCGTEHSLMRGTVTVLEPEEYADWLSRQAGQPAAATGRELFGQFRCNDCHRDDSGGTGPSLRGLVGSRVALDGGSAVHVDRQYLRDSIIEPAEQVVAGYRPLMPSFRGQVTEEQVVQLIEYIESLSADPERFAMSHP